MNHQLRYAWNTNGCANHRLYDAIELVADAGYQGLAHQLDQPLYGEFDVLVGQVSLLLGNGGNELRLGHGYYRVLAGRSASRRPES